MRPATVCPRFRQTGVGKESALPEILLQAGVAESVSAGGHLHGVSHRLITQRTIKSLPRPL